MPATVCKQLSSPGADAQGHCEGAIRVTTKWAASDANAGMHFRLQAKQCNGEKRQVELSTKLERMSLEKQALQNRNAVLEKVLAMREQELSRARLGAVQQSQAPEVRLPICIAASSCIAASHGMQR